MLRVCVHIVALIALAVATAAADTKTEAEADGFFGPVHTATTSRTAFAGGKPLGAPVTERGYVYDTLGRRTETFDSAGGHETRVVFEWSGDRLLRMLATSNDSSWLETRYMYAPNGKVVDTVVSNEKGMVRHEVPEHTASGKETRVYDANGSETERRVVQTWDEASHSWITRDYQGRELDWSAVERLDPKTGKRIELRIYDASGKPVQIMERRPDGSFQQAGDPSTEGKTWSTMDETGHPLEFYLDSGTTFDWHEMTWDKAGRMVSNTHYDRAHMVTARDLAEYEDDEHGNWIRKKELHCKGMGRECIVGSVLTRTITYY